MTSLAHPPGDDPSIPPPPGRNAVRIPASFGAPPGTPPETPPVAAREPHRASRDRGHVLVGVALAVVTAAVVATAIVVVRPHSTTAHPDALRRAAPTGLAAPQTSPSVATSSAQSGTPTPTPSASQHSGPPRHHAATNPGSGTGSGSSSDGSGGGHRDTGGNGTGSGRQAPPSQHHSKPNPCLVKTPQGVIINVC